MPELYEKLNVYKKALDLTVYIEKVVRNFDRYHKYASGLELRNLSRRILVLVAKANTKEARKSCLEDALTLLEELKILIRVCNEIKAFRSAKYSENATKILIEVSRQCEGWLRSQNSKSIEPSGSEPIKKSLGAYSTQKV